MVGLRRHWFGPGCLVARFRFRVHVPARQHLDEIDCLQLAGLPGVFRQTDLAMAPILLGSAFDQLANLVTFRPDADHVPDHETAIRHPSELEPDGVIGLCAGRRREIPVPDPFGPRLDIDGLDEFSPLCLAADASPAAHALARSVRLQYVTSLNSNPDPNHPASL